MQDGFFKLISYMLKHVATMDSHEFNLTCVKTIGNRLITYFVLNNQRKCTQIPIIGILRTKLL